MKPNREDLGKLVRQVWIDYAHENGDDKPGHQDDWEHLDEYNKEVDRRIGEAVYRAAVKDVLAYLEAFKKGMSANDFKLKPAERELLRQMKDDEAVGIVYFNAQARLIWNGIELAKVQEETLGRLTEAGYIDAETYRITEKGKELFSRA